MNRVPFVAVLLVLACSRGPAVPLPSSESLGQSPPNPYVFETPKNLMTDSAARNADGLVNVVVEIPAGTTEKWEVDEDGVLRWEFKEGRPRVVEYLAYPANYGMVPRTLIPAGEGGDGDPLDVVLLGPAIERGEVVPARIIGVLKMLDGGETDHKLIAVQEGTALDQARDLQSLDALFPGVTTIIETWFSQYKGIGEIESQGFSGIEEAERIVETGISAYRAAQVAGAQAAG